MEVRRRGIADPSVKSLCDNGDKAERNWHKRTLQLTYHMAGLGLTPQCTSGIAAFYHSTARFVSSRQRRSH